VFGRIAQSEIFAGTTQKPNPEQTYEKHETFSFVIFRFALLSASMKDSRIDTGVDDCESDEVTPNHADALQH
jgi:hypothetical protein